MKLTINPKQALKIPSQLKMKVNKYVLVENLADSPLVLEATENLDGINPTVNLKIHRVVTT